MRRKLFVIFILVFALDLFLIEKNMSDGVKLEGVYTVEGRIEDLTIKERYYSFKIKDVSVIDYSMSQVEEGEYASVCGKLEVIGNTEGYDRYLRSKGCGYAMNVKSVAIRGQKTLAASVRKKMKDDVERRLRRLYGRYSFMAEGIILSSRENFDQKDVKLFSKVGILHFFVASGLHVGIIVIFIDRMLFFLPYRKRVLAIIISTLFYAFLIGFTPSISRALIFIISYYIGVFAKRKHDAISMVSLIGLISIVMNPYSVFNLSLILSLFSVLSIAATYKYVKSAFKNDAISVSIAANILIMPIIYYYMGMVSIIAPISNLILGLFVAMLIPVVMISLALSYLPVVFLAGAASLIGKALMYTIMEVSDFLSKIPFSYVEFEKRSILFVSIYYFAVILFIIILEQKTIKEQFNELQGYNKGNKGI